MSNSLNDISDHALAIILEFLASEDVQDLLRFSRTSKRYHRAVLGAETAWQKAYLASYGPSISPPSGSGGEASSSLQCTWLARYKQRFLEDAFKRKAAAVQQLEQEVFVLSRTLSVEELLLSCVKEDLAAAQKTQNDSAVQEAHTYCTPVALTRPQGSATLQLPQNVQENKALLTERLAEATLECQKLSKMLEARRKELRAAQCKLQLLGP